MKQARKAKSTGRKRDRDRKGGRPSVILLAAGVGPGLRSARPGALHRVGGRTLLEAGLETAQTLSPSMTVVVVGPARGEIDRVLGEMPVTTIVQDPPAGSADGAARALASLPRGGGPVVVLSCDTPLLRPETLRLVLERQRTRGLDLALLSFRPPDPSGFGRVVRDGSGAVRRVAGAREASDGAEAHAGVYCFAPRAFREVLAELEKTALRGSADLADAVAILAEEAGRVDAVEAEDWREAWGIRTRRDLAAAEEIGRRLAVERALDAGATVMDPNTTRIGPYVEIEPDAVIHPFVSLEGRSVIGEGSEVLPFTRVSDSTLSGGAVVGPHSDVEGARIGPRSRVGPFARIRPGTVLEEDVRVGNFVETKKAVLRRGVKASHLSYLGDTEIGEETNVGAGVITCNYDGEKKNRTTIGRDVFIGSDTQFVAPVTVGNGAWIGAGSTITEDVPPGSLALSRVPQTIREGWVASRKSRKKKTGRPGDGGTR